MSTRNPRYDERVASEDSENVPIVSGQKIGDKENQSLLGNDPKYSTEDLYRNFFVMSAAFAVNHGCVVACLAYASTELGNEMGSVGSGILYVCYAVTAFFVSKPLVTTLGPKLGLFAGVFGYFIYVLGFCIAVASKYIFVDAAWLVSSISAAIGGIAGGLLWTAQGRYFSRHAKLYSESSGIPVEKVNATFAGVFATMFLGLEMCTKLLGTVIFLMVPAGASFLVFSLYTAASLVACVFVAGLDDLDDKPTWDFSYQTVSYHAGAAARLVWLDGRMALIVPFQLAFGFCSSFVPYYVFGTVIAGSDSLGSSYVGLLSALIVLTGASMAIPSAWAANKFGKPLVMTVGGLCLAYTGFAFFIFSDAQLGTWAAIVPLLIIYGIGRGTWVSSFLSFHERRPLFLLNCRAIFIPHRSRYSRLSHVCLRLGENTVLPSFIDTIICFF